MGWWRIGVLRPTHLWVRATGMLTVVPYVHVRLAPAQALRQTPADAGATAMAAPSGCMVMVVLDVVLHRVVTRIGTVRSCGVCRPSKLRIACFKRGCALCNHPGNHPVGPEVLVPEALEDIIFGL